MESLSTTTLLLTVATLLACGSDGVSENLPGGAFTSGAAIDTFDDLGIDGTEGQMPGTEDGMDSTGSGTAGDDATTGEEVCDPIPDSISHETDIAPIWVDSCAVASNCHIAGGTQPPDLETAAYDTLLQESSALTKTPWAVANDPDASYVFLKIMGRQAEVGGMGGAMPIGDGVLTSCQASLIEAWIVQGAAP